MKKLLLLIAITTFSVSFAFAQEDTKMSGKGEKSLYERLGGYDALAAVTDDIVGRIGLK